MERAQDIGKKGKGTLKFEDNIKVIGSGTEFTKQLKPRDSIKFIITPDDIQVADQIVDQVISDTEIHLKNPGAKIYDPNKEYSYKCLPKLDQSHVF